MKIQIMKRRSSDYSAPSIEQLDVKVEAGFAATDVDGKGRIPDLEFDD